MQNQAFEFPVGYHELHCTKIMDYQLNRWYSLGYIGLEPRREAAPRIRSLEDWKPEMVRQADKAVAEGRMTEAAFFYRSAEFFTLPADPDRRNSTTPSRTSSTATYTIHGVPNGWRCRTRACISPRCGCRRDPQIGEVRWSSMAGSTPSSRSSTPWRSGSPTGATR